MKTLTGSGRPRNPDDPLDPAFNPNEEPSYPEGEPEPEQPLEVPPPITPPTMTFCSRYMAFTIAVARESATVISRMVASRSVRVANRRVRHNFPWSSQMVALVGSAGKISLLGIGSPFPSLPHLQSGLR